MAGAPRVVVPFSMSTPDRGPDGFRHNPAAPGGLGMGPGALPGPRIRSDIVDVYVFARVRAGEGPPSPLFAGRGSHAARSGAMMEGELGAPTRPRVYFLQLLRSKEPLNNTWHPAMGHIDAGETAVACALREAHEELGLTPSHLADPARARGFWALEQVHPFFVPAIDAVVLSPRFALEVPAAFRPVLNSEHSDCRWVDERDARDAASGCFMWPGQRHAIAEILESLARDDAPGRKSLSVPLTPPSRA